MKNTVRTFIAITLDEPMQMALSEIISQLKTVNADVKWVEPHNIHLTLKFLGDVPLERMNAIKGMTEKIASQHHPLSFGINKLGAFPQLETPRIIWIGIDQGQSEMKKMVEDLDSELERFGVAREDHEFSAHITLGRIRSQKNLRPLTATLKSILIDAELTQNVDHLTLYQSTLASSGPVYEKLAEFRLSEKKE